MLQTATQSFKNEWPSNLIMEDISQSCQHYVVLAYDQELALSGAEELLLLSANAGEDALYYPVVKTLKV